VKNWRSPLALAATALALQHGGVARAAIDRGEALLDELSCASCHQPPAQAQDRYFIRPSAVLGRQGLRLTPQWLRGFLAQPAYGMPDLLHGMSARDKANAIEDLTHYLVSREAAAGDTFEWDPAVVAKGRELYHTVGCVACHAPFEPPQRMAADDRVKSEMESMASASVPFPDLARMTTVPQLAAFLLDPVKLHPAGRMPSSRLGDAEATAIAAYLLREQTPADAGRSTAPGLRFEYFEKRFNNLPNFDRLKVVSVGTVDHFDLSMRKRDENFAVRYRGQLKVPANGEYRFYTESDDGSQLLIDDKPVVDNDGIHPMIEKSGNIVLTPGEHAITGLFFQAAADFGLKVSWAGPGLPRQEIPGAALSHTGALMAPVGDQHFAVDAARAARGEALYAKLNCAACHQGGEGAAVALAVATPLASLKPDGNDDCLSETPRPGLPYFALAQPDREAIRKALGDPARLSRPLDAHALVERTLTVLNCYACHNRDNEGGAEGLRREYFSSQPPEVDLGDEGRIPPLLTGAGAKLQPGWMAKVLTEGASVRPYMAARMPQFGARNVGFLPAAFQAADGQGMANPDLMAGQAGAKAGRRLAGVTGLGCIACHNFADHPSLGVPAMDLTWMTQRLQTEWFHRYLLDPQSLRPGTRMPSFWPGGKAVNHDILNGDTDAQIAAIWTFLSRGRSADLPDGLIQGKMELVADKQAVMYRNFIQGAGTRAIGVAYPEKANLAFDANLARLALIWQGSFLDVAPHRTGRGMGASLPPMGHSVIAGPPGAPFALLSGTDAPWPEAAGGEAGCQFRGYTLDDDLRPAFSYDFGGIHVTDYPVAMQGREDPWLKRTLVFDSPHPAANLYMRVAMGEKIEPAADGAFLVDGQLTLKFGQPGAFVRRAKQGMELLVPVRFSGSRAIIEEDYLW
jgi:mono/diheme cytochrome c family protein